MTLISPRYDIYHFLERVAQYGYKSSDDYRNRAASESDEAMAQHRRLRTQREKNNSSAPRYSAQLHHFMYFMYHGAIADGTSDQEKQAYEPIVRSLVELGRWPAHMLSMFPQALQGSPD